MHPEEDVRLRFKDLNMYMDVDTVIMSLGTSPNPLISSTTKGLEINKRKMSSLLKKKQVRHPKTAYMPVVMP